MFAGSVIPVPMPPSDMGQVDSSTRGGAGFVPKRYAHSDGVYWGSPETCDALLPGFYMPFALPNGAPALKKLETQTDNLLRLPDPICDMLLSEFVLFWNKSQLMAERGLTVKRGLLLYGPPGSGKTSAVQLMAHHMIREMGGVVILVDYAPIAAAALQLLRQLEPGRPVILLYEDIDAIVERHGESGLLALLDGELQVGNVVNVATTNYPERLDPRFTDRPGRFDRITLVGMPEAPARRAYFEAKAPDVAEPRRERWVIASEGWSIAHLRELVVAHLVLGEDDETVIERLTGMREQLPKSEDARFSTFGFGERNAKRTAVARGRY